MRKSLKHRLAVILTLLGVVSGSLAVASPAQAYSDDVGWTWVSFETGNCNARGGYHYTVYNDGDYCKVDGVRYKKDPGGVGLYAVVRVTPCCGGQKVGRVEWHPNGEHLKVCDLANDGDTIHARLRYKSYDWYWKPLVSPPGTSTTVECTDGNYDFIDGTEIRFYVYDDAAMNENMAGFYNLYA